MSMKKLIEKFETLMLDEFYDTIEFLGEFATPIAKIRNHARNKSKVIIKHILKVLLNSQGTEIHHWCSELATFIDDCSDTKIKKYNRYPTSKEVYSWLLDWYSEPADIEGLLKGLGCPDYNKPEVMKTYYNQVVAILKDVTSLIDSSNVNATNVEEIVRGHIE